MLELKMRLELAITREAEPNEIIFKPAFITEKLQITGMLLLKTILAFVTKRVMGYHRIWQGQRHTTN